MNLKSRKLALRTIVSITAAACMVVLFQNCSNGFEVLQRSNPNSLANGLGSPPPEGFFAAVLEKTFYEGDILVLQPLPKVSATATFQWLKDGVEIVGATEAAFSLPKASKADAGSYVLRIRDSNRNFESPPMVVSILPAIGPKAPEGLLSSNIEILKTNQDLTVTVKATGSPTPLYGWRVENAVFTEVIDQKTDTIVLKGFIPSANSASQSKIRVVAILQNAEGTTEIVKEFLAPPPTFNTELKNTTASIGDVVELCSFVPYGPTYSWTKDGVAQAATTACLLVPSVSAADAGVYRVTATTPSGSVSSEARLTVTANPVLLEGLKDAYVSATIGDSSGSGFCVWPSSFYSKSLSNGQTIRSSTVVTFQWFKDGVLLANQSGRCYLGNTFTTADAGRYTVEVSNGAGKVSSSAILTVVPPNEIRIIKPLADVVVTEKLWADLNSSTVPPRVSSPLCVYDVGSRRYEWKRDGVVLPNETRWCLTSAPYGTKGRYTVTMYFEQNGVIAKAESSANFDFTQLENPAVRKIDFKNVAVWAPVAVAGTSVKAILYAVESTQLAGSTITWFKNGELAQHSRNFVEYVIPASTVADTGRYEARVNFANGQAGSFFFNLLILPTETPPYLSQVTSDKSDPSYFVNGRYVMNCYVYLGNDLKITWKKDGLVTAGAVGPCYPLPRVNDSTTKGVYEMTVMNPYGTKTVTFKID